MNAYEMKQAARQERYEATAAKLRTQAEVRINDARQKASIIPFGQPILVGHHSEGRDRRYREKIDNGYRKGYELEEKAEYFEAKAKSVGAGGISSDDPDATDKIAARLEELEEKQALMTASNKLVRKKDIPGLIKLGFTEGQAVQLFKPDFCGRIGFARYELTNNGANIRRLKQRVASLKREDARPDKEETHGGYTYREDHEDNRILFEFEGKPDDATRAILKQHGFRWSPTRSAWIRQLNNNGRYSAKMVKSLLDA